MNDNERVFAGGLLVALLAIAVELLLALAAAGDHARPGSGRRATSKVRDLATDRVLPATGPAL